MILCIMIIIIIIISLVKWSDTAMAYSRVGRTSVLYTSSFSEDGAVDNIRFKYHYLLLALLMMYSMLLFQ